MTVQFISHSQHSKKTMHSYGSVSPQPKCAKSHSHLSLRLQHLGLMSQIAQNTSKSMKQQTSAHLFHKLLLLVSFNHALIYFICSSDGTVQLL